MRRMIGALAAWRYWTLVLSWDSVKAMRVERSVLWGALAVGLGYYLAARAGFVFTLQPHPEAIAGAPLLFQLHALTACLLFAAWPFTRLVHVWSAPVGYLTRPYLVYRRRAIPPTAAGRSRPTSGSRRAA